MLEVEMLDVRREKTSLGKDELEFVASRRHDRRSGLRAHTDPIDPCRDWLGALRLDGHLETSRVDLIEQRRVQLQQGLSSGEHNHSFLEAAEPLTLDVLGELGSFRKGTSALAVDAEKPVSHNWQTAIAR